MTGFGMVIIKYNWVKHLIIRDLNSSNFAMEKTRIVWSCKIIKNSKRL